MRTLRPLLPVATAALLAALGCEETPLPSAAPITRDTATAAATTTAAAVPLPPMPKAPPLPATPAPLPELKNPPDNPLTAEKVALGKQLFFDKRLSKDGSASCETCHVPEKGWADGEKLSKKVGGAMNTRHSPTLWNVGYNDLWYWDGRAETLEKQIEAAWKGQMGVDPAAIAAALAKIPGYLVQFKTIYQADPTGDTIVKSLAAFVRTLRSGGSPWDKYEAGDKGAVSESAVRGFELFRNKAGCGACHAPPLYTNNGFHNTGVGFDKDVKEPDLGRGKISKNEKENGAFKTPTLRSATTHPPYFHDGRAATFEEAVDFMLAGGIDNPHRDERMKKPVKLSKAEREDLLAFLRALEVKADGYERPTLP
jgi:cytochrome c peroxidase